MRHAGSLQSFLAAGAASAVLALGGVAVQAQTAPDLAPKAGEIRLTVKLNERAVSFSSTLEPLARRTMAFEGTEYAPTDAMRAAAAELPAILAAKPEAAFVITAYAADPVVAYRRARAVRGELIERHQVAAAKLIAAGRAAPGHTGGATIVDIHAVDPGQCAGCGPTPFRSIAYDSGTMRLVTALPEMVAERSEAAKADPAKPETANAEAAKADVPKPEAKPAPAAAPKVVAVPRPPVRPAAPLPPKPATAEAETPARAAGRIVPAVPRAAPVVAPAAAPTRLAQAGCPRPRIIIDDYYPGGPIIPCRSAYRLR